MATINVNSATVINFVKNGVTTALDKLIFNGTTVWENWKLHTGNLVDMTSQTTPSPYTCWSNYYTDDPTALKTGYVVWDNNTGTYSNTNNSNVNKPNGWLKLNGALGGTIKPVTIVMITGCTTGGFELKGLKTDGSYISYGTYHGSTSNNSPASQTISIPAASQVAITALYYTYVPVSGGSSARIQDIKITSWYQKG